jgi:dTDP-4-amino-4,6-dideoxygalactose transaminase
MNIQLFKPKYRKEEILKEIEECLDLGWTGLGFKTNTFEEAFKKYTNVSHAHYVASNTVGLQIAIKILKDANKWKNEDEIITTPLNSI